MSTARAKGVLALLAGLALASCHGCQGEHDRVVADVVELDIYSGRSVLVLWLSRDRTLTGGWDSRDYQHPGLASADATARVFALADEVASRIAPGTYFMPESYHEPCRLVIRQGQREFVYLLNQQTRGRPKVAGDLMNLVREVSGLVPW
jgi:hypothetical protein